MMSKGKLVGIAGSSYGVLTLILSIVLCVSGYLSKPIEIKDSIIIKKILIDGCFIAIIHITQYEDSSFYLPPIFMAKKLSRRFSVLLIYLLFANILLNFVLLYHDAFSSTQVLSVSKSEGYSMQLIYSTLAILSFFISVSFLFGIRNVLPRWMQLLPDLPLIYFPRAVTKKISRQRKKKKKGRF